MRSSLLGEFMGTMVMMILGDGVVAGVLLKRSKAENSGWIVITTGWCFAVLCGIFTAILFGSQAADLNPAFAIAGAIQTGAWSTLLPYTIAEIAGAFTGAAFVWLHYWPHWSLSDDPEAKRAIFCTIPAVRNRVANFFSEVLATFILILSVGALNSHFAEPNGAAPGLSPYLVSCVVWGIGLSLGGTTGYAVNPARDFGPRLAHSILPIPGKGKSDWRYAPIPILGPAVGAVLAGYLLKLIAA
ncbi:MAG: MIP/aquaporin family protein [Acidobacteriaceae bacterium]